MPLSAAKWRARAIGSRRAWTAPPWFEKPPLLYWLTGAGRKLHLSDEWAARLPLALISLAFLWFFHRTLAREFSPRVALGGHRDSRDLGGLGGV